jgi:hypothetical protein
MAFTARTTISPCPGETTTQVYTHPSCAEWNPQNRYAVVLKSHGGGFTLGTTTDDYGWATTIVGQTDPIITSVDA